MSPYISLALILWMIAPGTKSDKVKLVDHLKRSDWPWFGDTYQQLCPVSQRNWPLCYNPRPTAKESTLERVGIPNSIRLSTELEIVFSAPVQVDAVCGKKISFPKLEPFHLNPNGNIDTGLLKKGAEIYRKFPSVSWTPMEYDTSELILIDAGYIKVNGYAINIKKSRQTGDLVGEALWSYSPPANPARHSNPNLIVITRKSQKGPMTLDMLLSSGCVDNGISVTKAASCRKFLVQYFSQVTIKGLQVYYTDGSSMYEQYRACTKSLFCNATCINKFRSYVNAQEPNIKFTPIYPDRLDMYVGLNFFSPALMKFTTCCVERIITNPYNFHTIQEDDLRLDAVIVNNNLESFMRVEFSGSAAMAEDARTLYSVMMVDSYNQIKTAPHIVHVHMWVTNLNYQDQMSTSKKALLISYTGPTPKTGSTHRYFIMLYSHKKAIYRAPPHFLGKHGCDLTKLPWDFKLRAISWFKVSSDEYTISKRLYKSGTKDSCKLAIPSSKKVCHMQFKDMSFAKRPTFNLTKNHTGAGVKTSINNEEIDKSLRGGAGVQLPSTHFWCPSTNPLVGVTLVSMFINIAMAGA